MHAHRMLNMAYDFDAVVIAGVRVERPTGVSAKQWIDYWEKICFIMEGVEHEHERDEEQTNSWKA